MKKNFTLMLLTLLPCLLTSTVLAQQGEWTWMKGDSIGNNAGVFGTQGVANPLNKPP